MLKPREIRLELVIATLALCASAAASIATVVQTSVVGNQLSASVWPYLSIATTFSPGEVALGIDNDGLGPAIVRDVRLSVDEKPVSTWRAAVKALVLGPRRTRARLGLNESDIGPGSVIRPGVTLTLLDLRSPLIDAPLKATLRKRVALSVCYCSILQRCWRVDERPGVGPEAVGDCGPPGTPLTY